MSITRNITLFFLCLLMSFSILYPQGSAGGTAKFESRYIADMPTAGIVPKGHFTFYTSAFSNGGLLAEFSAAIFTNFNMGLSFSGENVIGSGHVLWQKYPGIQIRYRVFDETTSIPAFTLGANTQGRGVYDQASDRSETLAPGLFLAASKSFKWLIGNIALHGGINYPIEEERETNNPNFYLGFEQSLGSSFSANFEYNANLDDNNRNFIDTRGLLNLGFRWAVASNLTIELQLRDILDHQAEQYNEFTRYIVLEYISPY